VQRLVDIASEMNKPWQHEYLHLCLKRSERRNSWSLVSTFTAAGGIVAVLSIVKGILVKRQSRFRLFEPGGSPGISGVGAPPGSKKPGSPLMSSGQPEALTNPTFPAGLEERSGPLRKIRMLREEGIDSSPGCWIQVVVDDRSDDEVSRPVPSTNSHGNHEKHQDK
jgi:hypothetical protein